MTKTSETKCNENHAGCKCASTEPLTVTAKGLAAMLSISVRKVWRMKSAGMLPKFIYVGASVRWRRSDVELWIESGCPNQSEFEQRKESGQC